MQLIHLSEKLVQRVISGRVALPLGPQGDCALALGSFDGLHLGHRQLIREVHAARTRQGLTRSCLFTFRGHPRLVLNGATPRLLTSWNEKLALLQDAGLDMVVAVEFCRALSRLPYREFVERFLLEMLGMRHLVGGHDIHLGADRGGTAESLRSLGGETGFDFTAVPAQKLADGRIISSSAIRTALAEGDIATATAMLGRHYAHWGEVGYGDRIGTDLGYPTANLTALEPEKLLPAPSVYAVRVHVPRDTVAAADERGIIDTYRGALPEMDRDGELRGILDTERVVFRGMLNHGVAPTVHEGGLPAPRLEVHILDFSGYIRERSLKIEWVARLRGERAFATVDELRTQLGRDEAEVRRLVS